VPIVALTAYVKAEIEEACMNAGIDEIASKPINMEELLQLLNADIP